MIWTEGRQPDCYGCHCSYLITDSDNQNSQSLMSISYDDMNRGSSAWLLWLSLLISYYRQWQSKQSVINVYKLWWYEPMIVSLTVMVVTAHIFISTCEWRVQMPPLTSENSHFLRSGPQWATLVMEYKLWWYEPRVVSLTVMVVTDHILLPTVIIKTVSH